MDALNSFIHDLNGFRQYQNKPMMKYPLTQEDINEIAEDIDYRLSPENLHCDGEISNAEANRKYNYLMQTYKDLKNYAKNQGLEITVKTYEI